MPIIGISGEVEGVLQAINKLPDRHGHERSFDRNDLGIVEMIANLASSTFHNSLEVNQQLTSMNNLKLVLKTGSRLITVRRQQDLVEQTDYMLRYLFDSRTIKLYFIDQENLEGMYTFDSKDNKKAFDVTGLVGEAVSRRQLLVVKESSKDPRFNGRNL